LNLPLKHNQLVVAQFISLIRVDDCYWCKDLLAAENNESRQKILKLEVNTGNKTLNDIISLFAMTMLPI
jgi:hypothetical protein